MTTLPLVLAIVCTVVVLIGAQVWAGRLSLPGHETMSQALDPSRGVGHDLTHAAAFAALAMATLDLLVPGAPSWAAWMMFAIPMGIALVSSIRRLRGARQVAVAA